MKKTKKIIETLCVLTLTVGMLAGCGSKAADKTGDKTSESKTTVSSQSVEFKEKDGLLTYTDTKNSPFENSGLEINVRKGEGGYAKFIKTDKKGKPTVEYYTFDYSKNMVEKYYYVSAMGRGFYYSYDLSKGELVKVEDAKHNDITQKTKDSKRWDKAATTTDEDVKALKKYFKEQYKMTIKDYVLKK